MAMTDTERGVFSKRLTTLLKELDTRTEEHERIARYDGEGDCPLPEAVVKAHVTNAYAALTSSSDAPWGTLAVDSKQDRIEASGITDVEDESAAKKVWRVWQENEMDSESKLGHRSALLDGRASALVWPNSKTAKPEIFLEDCTQMVVQYREGSRHHRTRALRRWVDDDDVQHATLYEPDAIWKFRAAKKQEQTSGESRISAGSVWWEPREVDGEAWPLKNGFNVVPATELGVNRRLKAGTFPFARGEYAHATGLIDRVYLLTFLGLVIAVWMGFPLRYVIGDKILRDDDGNQIAPFDSKPDSIAQLENPQASIGQLEAADRKNLSVFGELEQFAVITKTPKHYFPHEGGLSNIAEPTIRAFEGAMHAACTDHKASLGGGHEETLRLAGLMLPDGAVDLSPRAKMEWLDHESRSLAERADAALKMSTIGLPPVFVAEQFLNLTQDQLGRLEGALASNALTALIQEARQPTAPPVVEPALNGNG